MNDDTGKGKRAKVGRKKAKNVDRKMAVKAIHRKTKTAKRKV